MIDLEDSFLKIISYMMEEVTLEDDTVVSRLNYYIRNKNAEKGDSLLDEIPNDSSRFVLNQRMRDYKAFKNWIDIAIAESVEFDSNFNAVAKTYIFSINALYQDDLSNAVFYNSIRMAEVLKDLMVDFFANVKDFGFIYGFPQSNILPERVSVEGLKALKSGVLYTVVIQ